MAVESKPGASTSLGAGVPPNGNTTSAAVAALAKRKRPSSLMKAASELPTVEHSLEEFIAKANQTLVDASTWAQADQQAKEEEAKRREQDAQRWKQAELQMRESEAREASLRRQLDGLQGKLAEAEARAAVAMSASSSGGLAVANEVAMSDLKGQLEQSQQRLRAAEEQTRRMSADLEAARLEGAAPRSSAVSIGDTTAGPEGAAERIRIAEAKAAKALAAARAAAAGLTVSAADLAAIESGLTVAAPPPRRSPVLAITLAFIGGVALMVVVWKLALDKGSAPAAQVAPAPQTAPAVQPPAQPADQPPTPPAPTPQAATAPAPAPAPASPTVTPIDPPTVTPIDERAAKPEPPKPEARTEPEPPKPAAKPAPRPAVRPAKPAKPDKPSGGIVDPF